MMYNICSGAIQWKMPEFMSDGDSNVCFFRAFTYQNSHLKFELENLGQGQRLHFFAVVPFEGKCQKSTNVIFYILLFSIRYDMCESRTQTHTHTHTHTQKRTSS